MLGVGIRVGVFLVTLSWDGLCGDIVGCISSVTLKNSARGSISPFTYAISSPRYKDTVNSCDPKVKVSALFLLFRTLPFKLFSSIYFISFEIALSSWGMSTLVGYRSSDGSIGTRLTASGLIWFTLGLFIPCICTYSSSIWDYNKISFSERLNKFSSKSAFRDVSSSILAKRRVSLAL